MKLAFVIPINGISGGLYVVYRHAHFLLDKGHEVEILVADFTLGLNISCFPNFRVPVKSYYETLSSPHQYDAVIGTWWETMYDAFLLNSKNYILFCQSDERRFYLNGRAQPEVQFLERLYENPAFEIITEAKWVQKLFKDEFERHSELAPNGVDLQLFSPKREPLESKKSEKVRILIEGPGSIPYKRIGFALKVCQDIPNTEVWYVSSDGYTEPDWKFDRIFKKLKLDQMGVIYTACDVLVKLSTVEGVFGPPLEMMACGGTAVVSNVTGSDEYITHEENALIVPMDNFEAARSSVLRLVESKSLRETLSKSGLETAQKLSWEKQLPLFEKAVQNCCQRQISISKRVLSTARYDATVYNLHKNIQKQDNDLTTIKRWRPYRTWKGLKTFLSPNSS